jgi:hypothetical protein
MQIIADLANNMTDEQIWRIEKQRLSLIPEEYEELNFACLYDDITMQRAFTFVTVCAGEDYTGLVIKNALTRTSRRWK